MGRDALAIVLVLQLRQQQSMLLVIRNVKIDIITTEPAERETCAILGKQISCKTDALQIINAAVMVYLQALLPKRQQQDKQLQ